MTNPAAAIRMLITYAICIPLAILIGYLLTNPLDYSTLGFLGIVIALILSPIFIKSHYPILIFGLACPMTCFFLVGRPPLAQVVVILSLGISIVERATSSERRFISVPVMTWPLLCIAAMAYLTAELTGGISLHQMGGDAGGGRKYISLFIGIATFFALTSRAIPLGKWKLYLALFMLPVTMGLFGDLFPFLPGPLKYINLLFPSSQISSDDVSLGTTRLTALAHAAGIIPIYLIARYGLRGIFMGASLWRPVAFIGSFVLIMTGGYRNTLFGFGMTVILIFFIEGLHRTRMLLVLLLAGTLGAMLLAAFSDQLPYTFQRSLSFLPLKWKTEVTMDADASSEWRFAIWRAVWPKVPEHLLLGKGYALSKEDYDMIGQGTFAQMGASHVDAAEQSLAISSDYHSGPLSTLMCFGIWGAIGILWLMAATVFVLHRNYQYGDPALRTFNIYMLAACLVSTFAFFFIFGAFDGDVGNFARMAGFSLAMNGGLAKLPAKSRLNSSSSLTATQPQPA
jgi:O-Antigen ligase